MRSATAGSSDVSLDRVPFRILSLDGGGSKGVYTLGVLKEFEKLVQAPLHTYFDLMYGTSTGAIIVALLALGGSVSEAEDIYFKMIPEVMGKWFRRTRSKALKQCLETTFREKRFDCFKTNVGIVATNYERERPLIFKTSVAQAFQGKSSFAPGFGCFINEALLASSAAFPFFRRMTLPTENLGSPEVMDGGFVANNPTLFSIADALQSLGADRSSIKILSVGVGHYNEPQKNVYSKVIFNLWPFKMIEKQFAANTNTIETMRKIFFSDITCVRIDKSFPDRQYDTDLLEADPVKLKRIFGLGQESFREQENEILEKFIGATAK